MTKEILAARTQRGMNRVTGGCRGPRVRLAESQTKFVDADSANWVQRGLRLERDIEQQVLESYTQPGDLRTIALDR